MLADPKTWGIISLTIFVKLLLSPSQSLIRAIATVASGVLAAVVFSEPTIVALNLEQESYKILVVCFWALTGENVIRRVLDVVEDDEKLFKLLEWWRGSK